MNKLVVLGAGTAGTMVANKLNKVLNNSWSITIIDQDEKHYYQPGFLFIPFGTYLPSDVVKNKSEFLNSKINFIVDEITLVDPNENIISLKTNENIHYDYLIIATGTEIDPTETEGLKGPLWRKNIFDFYTFEGAVALSKCLKDWKGGELVVNISEMPIKCPVAPLEFAFLADDFFKKQNIRENVNITYVTPLSGAFTKPIASKELGQMLKDRNIKLVSDFSIMEVDNDKKEIISYDEQKIKFDLLITIPTNKGSEYLDKSNLGDELNFVPTNKESLQSKKYENIFVIGDTTDVPASKAGSVAHFQAEVLIENFISLINNQEMKSKFDGHANCFIESGNNKALLIDFNYTTEPLPGKFPFSMIGPMKLLKESRRNHLGKLFFRWVYWNLLIKGKKIPFIPTKMSLNGKIINNK